jgi:hypothetical protein
LNYGFDPIEEEIESITKARYYPDSKSIWIKIIADRKSGRILGSQIVGGEGVKERIDLIALGLLLKADVRDLSSYDACYVPPASPVWEPLNIAASQTAKQLWLRIIALRNWPEKTNLKVCNKRLNDEVTTQLMIQYGIRSRHAALNGLSKAKEVFDERKRKRKSWELIFKLLGCG